MPETDKRPYFPTDEDRAWMKERMEKTGIGVQELAEHIGVTRQAIYLIRDGVTQSTVEWGAIVAKLGGVPPGGDLSVSDARLQRIIKKWPTLSESDRELVEQLAERLGLSKP